LHGYCSHPLHTNKGRQGKSQIKGKPGIKAGQDPLTKFSSNQERLSFTLKPCSLIDALFTLTHKRREHDGDEDFIMLAEKASCP